MAGKRVFKNYSEVNGGVLKGFTVANVSHGINAEDSGIMIELEKRINNGIIGIDIVYDPEDMTPMVISKEYIKNNI